MENFSEYAHSIFDWGYKNDSKQYKGY
jgi:hypothetical protein